MTYSAKGRADHLDLGDWNAICSMCGRKRKASTMVKNWQGQYRCPEHNEPRHPQDFVKAVPDIQTPPWVQPPVDLYAMPTITATAAAPTVSVPIPSNPDLAGTATAPAAVVTVPEDEIIPTLTFQLGTGAAANVTLNIFGSVTTVATATGSNPELPTSVNVTTRVWPGGDYRSLRFGTQPTDTSRNTAISPAVTVRVVNTSGSTVTSFTDNITISLASGSSAGGIGGTLTVAAVAGVATFSNVSLGFSGSGFSLQASMAGLLPVNSLTFSIPTDLVFTTNPGATVISEDFTIVVTARDTAGNTDLHYNGEVLLEIESFSGTQQGVLSGPLGVFASDGVATFSGLKLDRAGTYTLRATALPDLSENAGTPEPVVSGNIVVAQYLLEISANTTDYDVRAAFVTAFGSPPASTNLLVRVTSSVVVSATSTGIAALTWGTPWTGTPTFTWINNGYVIGQGGTGGGVGNGAGSPNGNNGSSGGNALELSGQTVTIINASGGIWGGGGGGGGGGIASSAIVSGSDFGEGIISGGGGGGGPGGSASLGGSSIYNGILNIIAGNANRIGVDCQDDPAAIASLFDALGTVTSGAFSASINIIPTDGTAGGRSGITATVGVGGIAGNASGTGAGGWSAISGIGGNGASDFGAAGNAGTDGTAPTGTPGSLGTGGAGGAAGKAINLTGGTATFVSGSGSPNVKGAVS